MIPKIIHYCWFGKGNYSTEIKNYIQSWKLKNPDYKVIEWNEGNYNIEKNRYIREAYSEKKYAFVTDYVRLDVLYNYGGVYLDTDIEILKSLDNFLQHRLFLGYEKESLVQTGLMAAEENHPLIADMLDYYKDRHFINSNGKMDTTANTVILTNILMEKYNMKKNETNKQTLMHDVNIYPIEYFCAKDWLTGEILSTDKTISIHHYSASWLSSEDKERMRRNANLKNKLNKMIGKNNLQFLINLKNKLLK